MRPEIFFGETRPINGNQLQFQDGAITKAFRTKGAFYLMDEANMCSPGVLAKCHRAYAGFEIYLEENNYECVRKSPGVTMFMACNALNNSTEAQLHSGVQQMNRAFLDRFGVTIRTDYPNEKEETHILMNALEKHYKKEFPKLIKSGLRDVLKKIVEVAQKIRVQIKDGVLPISFSVRRTVGLAMLYCYYEDVTRAVRASILNMEEPDDAESIDIVFKTVFGDQYTSLGELTNDSSKEKQF
jgi:MoxR-like ATPase